ncbi:3-hydroxyacyl-CoA dehydrogenase family protein [Candidatus Bathyarchaeota archaeon]|nr:3-hydroxyacyl-CoA dehydrogenase family protein [Candidatus Bathyarchaeota archaeon]
MYIRRIAIIGAGVMGSGIAQVCASAGYETAITRKHKELFKETYNRIRSNLWFLMQNKVITKKDIENALSKIKFYESISEAAKKADFIIEAVTEDISLKKEIFKKLDQVCPQHAIIASTTSSFSISELASATNRPHQVVGTHWWNPPYLMPIVEIVKGRYTSSKTIRTTRRLISKLGKVPVICEDSPGLIGVRLQSILAMEAVRLLEEEDFTPEDIDTVIRMTLGLRLPILGIFEIMDFGGLDTFFRACEHLHKTLGERFRPPDMLKRKVERGELGVKTGKGFYIHNKKFEDDIIRKRDQRIINLLKALELLKHEL